VMVSPGARERLSRTCLHPARARLPQDRDINSTDRKISEPKPSDLRRRAVGTRSETKLVQPSRGPQASQAGW
jgi:hypothetical protein